VSTSASTPQNAPTHRETGAGSGLFDSLAAMPPARRLLRLTVFWKIFLANVALIVVGGSSGAMAAITMGQASPGALTMTVITTSGVVIMLGVVINAILVKTALSPLEALEETARRVGLGETEARAQESPLADSALARVTQVFNDMLDSISANQTRQQELARRVLESEERERERIAHELYSGTAQTLAGVLVRLRIAERHLTSGANDSIIEIREEVVSALEEIRGVARRLRPPELDELGVRVALEAHARSMTENRRMDVRFHGDVPVLSRETSLALFRIVQEAVSNAVLHSGADTVEVTFASEGARLNVDVVDDGCGFDLAEALARPGRSLGLFGMHERAGYVQGELSLESGPGRGTRVRVALPLTPRRDSGSIDGTVDRLVDGIVEDVELAAASVASTRDGSPPF
jgi:two-component system sensor histidine kinase UhpB